MQCENQSGFGGSSTDGTLTSTDSNVSNKDVQNGTLNSTDSGASGSRPTNTTHASLDVFGLLQQTVGRKLNIGPRISVNSFSQSNYDNAFETCTILVTTSHSLLFLKNSAILLNAAVQLS